MPVMPGITGIVGSRERAAAIASQFRARTGRNPDGVWAAPGRVNIMGEHTDYNGGLVLPFAIDQEAVAAVAVRDDDVITCASLDVEPAARFRLRELRPGAVTGWAAYVLGVVWALRDTGVDVPGLDIVVASDVPIGAGLSSSAALETAVALAVAHLTGSHHSGSHHSGADADADRTQLAIAARRAETDMVGAPVGIMDQMVALHGRAGCALLLDCRSLDVRAVPLTHLQETAGLRLLVIDTRVAHAHAAGGYAERRRACERAAELLGVPALRDASIDDVDRRLDGDLLRCARHVVTEIARVRETAAALDSGDIPTLRALFTASHASMRDDFRISCAEVDAAVEVSTGAGAVAARMTGGGFGGCVLAIVPATRCAEVAAAVASAFRARGFAPPRSCTVQPSAGAHRLDIPGDADTPGDIAAPVAGEPRHLRDLSDRAD
jgi:galactokinase